MKDIFQQAAKTAIRFNTANGTLTTEDLYNISLSVLDDYAIQLNKEVKSAEVESFIKPARPADKEKILRFEVVKAIVEARVADLDKARKSQITKAKNAKIREAIANKKDSALQEASMEDLEKMLEDEEA